VKTCWEQNPRWQDLGPLEVGDLVQLQVTSGFDYVVNVIILATEGDELTGKVEAVFDRASRAWICCGEILNYLGTELKFPAVLVRQVIRKHQA
jgi:hypothetical protein